MRRWLMPAVLVVAALTGALTAFATEIDQDYYAAAESPERLQLLRLVDTYHTNRVVDSLRDRNLNAAIGDLKYTLERFPNHRRALTLLGSVAQLARMPSLGTRYYEHALALYPQYAVTHAQYGEYLVTIGRIDDGVAQLQQAIELDPTLAVAHGWLAEAYSKRGQVELARRAGEEARRLGYRAALRTPE